MPFRHFNRGDMNDERIELRASLGGENLCNGLFARGVGGKTVNRFRRHGDEPAHADDAGGVLDFLFIERSHQAAIAAQEGCVSPQLELSRALQAGCRQGRARSIAPAGVSSLEAARQHKVDAMRIIFRRQRCACV